MLSESADHETILATGGKQILEVYRTGKARADHAIIVFVTDVHNSCGRAFAERVLPSYEIEAQLGFDGGTTVEMRGLCSFAIPLEKFAAEEASRDALTNVSIPVVVIAKGTMKIFDVSYDDGGTLRRHRLIASGAIDADGNQCELRKA